MKKLTTILTLSLLTLFNPEGLSATHELRTWNAKDGTESVEGTFRRVDGRIVTIMLPTNRILQLPLANLSDADVQYVEAVGSAGENPAANQPLGSLGEKLAGHLVDDRGESVNPAENASGAPKYYLMYYSASWCPPCRDFTPDLVRWSSRARSNLGIETVLVPFDKSEEEMLKYMSDYRMRFPGLKYDQRENSWVPKSDGSGIPAMMLVDADGKKLLSTADIERGKFFREVESLLAK